MLFATLRGAKLRLGALFAVLVLCTPAASRGTSVIPISDSDLQARADVVVHGIVTSSEVTVDGEGRPEMLTFIEPLSVLKGRLSGSLVLHQLGGMLPDGRFLKMWGAPEYIPGREVIVFAIARPEGEYQTAEMMLGKFEVRQDATGAKFAVPALSIGGAAGLDVYTPRPRKAEQAVSKTGAISDADPGFALDSQSPPRSLARFLGDVRTGHFGGTASLPSIRGELSPVTHQASNVKTPKWGYINNILFRYTNGATTGWTLSGTSNVTGGGIAEATAALAAWTGDPFSNINYTVGSSGNAISLSAPTSGCGWSTCLDGGGGVIGCGGPNGGGANTWRGDTYNTISGGHVEIRPFCTTNQWQFVLQSVIMHELGHTLGLGHSDQNVSPHDTCRGDEDAATMRSVAQTRSTLGTDDQDAARWLYGDGLTWCSVQPAPTISSVTPNFGPAAGGTVMTITGNYFQSGATVTVGGIPAGAVTFVNATTLTATAPAGSGTVAVAVTNPDTLSASLPSAFTYNAGVGFYTVTPCRILDTRRTAGPLGAPALSAGGNRTFVIASQCGIPVGAKSVSVNVTITNAASAGYVIVYPPGVAQPVVSVLNYRAGQTRANNAILPLGASGDVIVNCGSSFGTVDFLVDVNGYFQ